MKRAMLTAIAMAIAILTYPALIDAKPSFDQKLYLMWQVQPNVTDVELHTMKGKGINLVQAFGLFNHTDTEIEGYLDRMHKENFGVIMSIIGGFKKNKINENHVAQVVTKWKDHPALFAWQLFDEPSNKKIPVLFQEDAYRFLKKLDSKHPVFLSWNGTSSKHYQFFSEKSFDILDLHAYIRTEVGRRQINLIKSFQRHRQGIYPVSITIAALNRPKFPPLPADALQKQYEFFFVKNNLTRNIGFYGWELSRNVGINQDPDLMRQFLQLPLGTRQFK